MKVLIENLLKENEELALKICKITNYIGSEKFFKLSLLEQDMIKSQLFCMMKYNKILKRRIKFYKELMCTYRSPENECLLENKPCNNCSDAPHFIDMEEDEDDENNS